MSLMTVNGADLWVDDTGGASPAVIFTHALFFSGKMYDAQIAALKETYRCITVDWRGMGRSGKPLGGYDVDNLARDIMCVADTLNIERFHWIGMSVGGVTGIRNAAQFPDRIASLCVGGASAEAEPIEKVVKYEALLAGYAADPASVLGRATEVLYGTRFKTLPEHAAALAAEQAAIVNNDGPAVQRASAAILRRVDIRHMLPHVQCPTTVFVGEEDAANGPEKARTIAEGIPDARLEIIPDCGHQPNVEATEETTRIIRDHLARATA